MSHALVLPDVPESIDVTADPASFVVAAVSHAKGWLEQARTTDLPEVVEAKARAEAIRCYVAQRDMGRDAELAATEIVRRAERRIGELIREGQSSGEISKRGDNTREDQPSRERLVPTDFAAEHELSGHGAGIYAMTDGVSSEEFEEALSEAKEEGNLSRRNVVRKVRDLQEREPADEPGRQPKAVRVQQIREMAAKAYTSRQIAASIGVQPDHVRRLAADAGIELQADRAIGRVRPIDSNRVVAEAVSTLEHLPDVLELVAFAELDRESVEEWVSSLRRSLRALQRFTKELSSA
jgi:hypothetical protein